MPERLCAAMRALRRAEGGNVALIFALVLPVLLVCGMGGVELNQVLSDHKRTQDVADAAALMGAGQLGVSPVGAGQRAVAFAQAQLGDVMRYASVNVGASAGQNNTMTVTVDTQRPSFFGDVLPPGGFHTHVSSTAVGVNTAPLCVLATASPTGSIQVNDTSQLQAGACMIHSNASLATTPAASILAAANEAGTVASGSISVAASTQAPNIADPFAGVNVNPLIGLCAIPGLAINVTGGQSLTLPAGVHTAPVMVSGNGVLTLGPGDHYFCKTLSVTGNGALNGTDVDMVFDGGAALVLNGSAAMTLSGRQSGPLAGFALIADRNVTGNFALSSDNIAGLTGTVYVPTATLVITGTKTAGGSTPWTVIVAQNLAVNGGAKLIINSDYAASSVPVPTGVGNHRMGSGTKLTQ